MKLKLLLILLFIATLSTYADNARVVIKQKSGNETILELATNPVITFSGEDMVVKTNLTTISIPLGDIDNYTAYDGTTDIRSLSDDPQYVNGHVIFSGLAQGAEARVYTIDGRFVSRQPADASGRVDISLDSLPKGVYVISTPNSKLKIMN